jgi:hypothetical protein
MGEHLADVLLKAGGALHWLGQYHVANACILMSRLARARDLDTLDALETFVVAVENMAPAALAKEE